MFKDQWPVLFGIAVQTIVILFTVGKVYGSIMKKFGEFETKIDTLWHNLMNNLGARR